MPRKKPAEQGPGNWEAQALNLSPRGTPVQILGREWPPGEWLPITDDEKLILDANYNVLQVREVKDGG